MRPAQHRVLKQSTGLLDDAELRIPAYLTRPESLRFPTSGGETAFALFYPPHNADYAAPAGEKPPLLVKCHGGPTAAASSALNLGTQFWTSRGIAVLDVNYGGSTGFGRAYRERLDGNWGVVDVEDCDQRRQVPRSRAGASTSSASSSRGGSAGGYTTLAALVFHDFFAGGASYYGVSDVAALARDTHKFESRYLDWLIGAVPGGRGALPRALAAVTTPTACRGR